MSRVTFYFDPLCPWAWLTSLWVREVREHRPLDVDWKFFSLAEVNELDASRNGPLRIAALARREGGNDAVDRAYLGLGRLFHENRFRFETLEELQEAAAPALEDVGLDPTLAQRALSDDSTLEDVVSESSEAREALGAFGVPWLVVDDQTFGFFGPVVSERLRGEQALELWDHFAWIGNQPYLHELKRGRLKLPGLQGLSAEFSVRDRVAG